ncbi:uncharacterized protein RSE6_07188 [Rhynchosporium secalis]|uniref:Uncharacterized protein n=1 Tax=Rhynchosporium secalis TaxID=38038 RepID=A0A1E1MCB5_RHYSE|nr:uncharacterized protein RSE6_07188 [Rhynchosporium secalis]
MLHNFSSWCVAQTPSVALEVPIPEETLNLIRISLSYVIGSQDTANWLQDTMGKANAAPVFSQAEHHGHVPEKADRRAVRMQLTMRIEE